MAYLSRKLPVIISLKCCPQGLWSMESSTKLNMSEEIVSNLFTCCQMFIDGLFVFLCVMFVSFQSNGVTVLKHYECFALADTYFTCLQMLSYHSLYPRDKIVEITFLSTLYSSIDDQFLPVLYIVL